VRLLIVEDTPAGVVQREHAALGTRLGAGLADRGALDPGGMRRTCAAVSDFVARVAARRATLCAIATSAVRRADDGIAFAARIEAIAGVPLRVLSGDEEAAASFRGATHARPAEGGRVAVVDVGGGSVEVGVGRAGVLEATRSIEIGSVRVIERHPELAGATPGARARGAAATARAEIAARVAPFAAFAPVDSVRAVAGTPLTLAAVALESHVGEVSGVALTRVAIDAAIERLLDLDLAGRRALPGMLAERADVLPGGALVLSETLGALGAPGAVAESDDLLLGILLAPETDRRWVGAARSEGDAMG